MSEFSAGDVVYLKSSTSSICPKMTIEDIFVDIHGKTRAICVWFQGSDLRRDNIVVDALVNIEGVRL